MKKVVRTTNKKPKYAKTLPFKGDREAVLLQATLTYLKMRGYLAWRMPVGPVIRGGGAEKIRFSKSPIKGFPDLACILKRRPGVLCAIELKVKGNKLSPEQKEWKKWLNDAGAVCITAWDIVDLWVQLQEVENAVELA